MSGAEEQMHSRRWVTSGYQNALHRAYLYGLGLTDRDMEQPFVGIAQCINDARPEARALTTAFDLTRDAVAAAGMTSRHFLAPVAAQPVDAADWVVTRELAADSCELVVRGHWYDVLMGVAGTPSSMFGVAQAICRLRIPGLVVVPTEAADADPETAAALVVLVGLGLAIDTGDEDTLRAACRGLRDEIGAKPRVLSLGDDIRGGLLEGQDVLPALWPGLAAIAHECGVESVADYGITPPTGITDISSAAVAGIDYPGPVPDSPLSYDRL